MDLAPSTTRSVHIDLLHSNVLQDILTHEEQKGHLLLIVGKGKFAPLMIKLNLIPRPALSSMM